MNFNTPKLENTFKRALLTNCAKFKARKSQNERSQPDNDKDNDKKLLPFNAKKLAKKLFTTDSKTETIKSSLSSISFSEYPLISKLIDLNDIENEAQEIIQVVRPQWIVEQDNNQVKISSEALHGGITNHLYIFYRETDPKPRDTIVIKVYGENTEKIIDRAEELETIQFVAQYDLGPQLYAVFDNGLCYEYFHGEILDSEAVKSPEIYPIVADQVALFHTLPFLEEKVSLAHSHSTVVSTDSGHLIGISISSTMWDKMRQFVNLLEHDIFVTQPDLKDKLEYEANFKVEYAMKQIKHLERLLEKQDMPLAMCHNDLLLGNMIYMRSEQTIKFIDYEYAMTNYIPYDVANHFNEFGRTEDGLPDYSKMPSEAFKKQWIGEYLRAYKTANEESSLKQEDFEKWVKLCSPASHLFWSLWGAVQTARSDKSFDYLM